MTDEVDSIIHELVYGPDEWSRDWSDNHPHARALNPWGRLSIKDPSLQLVPRPNRDHRPVSSQFPYPQITQFADQVNLYLGASLQELIDAMQDLMGAYNFYVVTPDMMLGRQMMGRYRAKRRIR